MPGEGTPLAEAFVKARLDTTGIREDLDKAFKGAGPVVIKVQADLAKFRADVAVAKREASGSIKIGVSGDIDQQLRKLKQRLQANGIGDLLDFNFSPTQVDQQLRLLKRKIDAAQVSDLLSFNIDQGAIDVQLAKLKKSIADVGSINIGVKTDDAAITKTKIELDSIKDKTVKINVKQSGAGVIGSITGTSGIKDAADANLLQKAILALNIATGVAEPALAALTVTAGGLVTVFAAAGFGIGAYAAAVKPQISAITAVMADQTAAAGGSATAVKTYQAALKALTPDQKELFTNISSAQTEFKNWSNSLAGVTLKPLDDGLELVSPLLKDLTPFAKDASGALDGLLTRLDSSVKSNGFQAWLKGLQPLVKPVITDLGDAVGDVATGIGGLIRTFEPFAIEVLGGIDSFTEKFSAWAQSLGDGKHTGFNAMISEFQNNWPVVKTDLGDLLVIVKNVIEDMTGISTGANSKWLFQLAEPMLDLLKAVSGNQDLVRTILYLLALKDAANKISPIFTGIASAAKAMSSAQGFVQALLSGKNPFAPVALPMQKAGDTMVDAAAAMQKAADTMVGAGSEEETAGAEQAAAGTAEVAAGGEMAGLGAELAAASPLMGALGIALLGATAYLAGKSANNVVNYFKGPGAQAATSIGGTTPGAFTSYVPPAAVNAANAQNAAANANPANQGLSQQAADAANAGNAIKALDLQVKALNNTFGLQKSSASAAGSDLDAYAASVQKSGTASKASKQAADLLVNDIELAGISSGKAQALVNSYTAAIQKNGLNSSQAAAAREKMTKDIAAAAANAKVGQSAVTAYSTAVKNNGAQSSQAQSARRQLVSDLQSAGLTARQANQIVTQYTQAIVYNKIQSSDGHMSREQVISDLEQAGINARTATAYADNYTASLKRIPASERTNLVLSGNGTWSVTEAQADLNSGKGITGVTVGIPAGVKKALGGTLPGYQPGVDSIAVMASPGEGMIVPEAVVGLGGPAAIDAINRQYAGYRGAGYAAGGVVGMPSGIVGGPQVDQQALAALGKVNATNNLMITTMKAQMTAYIKKQLEQIVSTGAPGQVTSGVAQWASTILKALKLVGLPASLLSDVEYQMQTESGGNEAAINLWDSNAAAGHPSKGLMQVIQPTFDEYHVAGTSTNIYNPLANIAAALNYAKHNKGFGSGAGQVGSGHGYAKGGTVTPFAAAVTQAISGAPKGGWLHDVSTLKSGLSSIGVDLGIKGLTAADKKKLKGEQSSEENQLLLAQATTKMLQTQSGTLTKADPGIQKQINALSKLSPLSASEKKALATLKAALARNKKRITAITNALKGKPVAKAAAAASASTASSSASSSSSSGSSAASSASAATPDPGAWVGALPSAPGASGLLQALSGGDFAQPGPAAGWLPGGTGSDTTATAAGSSAFSGSSPGSPDPVQAMLSALNRIAKATEQGPARTAGGLGQALNGVGRGATGRALYGTGTGYGG